MDQERRSPVLQFWLRELDVVRTSCLARTVVKVRLTRRMSWASMMARHGQEFNVRYERASHHFVSNAFLMNTFLSRHQPQHFYNNSIGNARSPATTPDMESPDKAAALLLVAVALELEAVLLPVLELPLPDRVEDPSCEVLVVFPALLEPVLSPPVAPAVIVTLTKVRSLPVRVALVVEEVLAGRVSQFVSVAVRTLAVSYTPAVAKQNACVVPVILQSMSPMIW